MFEEEGSKRDTTIPLQEMSNETVGSAKSGNWVDRLSSIFTKKKIAAAAVVATTATALGATGHLGPVLNTADAAIDKTTSLLTPDISKEFTTPQEILAGTMDVRIDGDLKGRREPNMSGDVVDWKKVRLVTSTYDEKDGLTKESFLDLEEADGFTVDNPLFVNAANPEGGTEKGRWVKLLAIDKDDKKFDLYINYSTQTSEHIDLEGDFMGISQANLAEGKTGYIPKEPGKNLPLGEINHVIPLVKIAAE